MMEKSQNFKKCVCEKIKSETRKAFEGTRLRSLTLSKFQMVLQITKIKSVFLVLIPTCLKL